MFIILMMTKHTTLTNSMYHLSQTFYHPNGLVCNRFLRHHARGMGRRGSSMRRYSWFLYCWYEQSSWLFLVARVPGTCVYLLKTQFVRPTRPRAATAPTPTHEKRYPHTPHCTPPPAHPHTPHPREDRRIWGV